MDMGVYNLSGSYEASSVRVDRNSLGLVGDPYPPSGASFLAPRLRGIVDGLVLMAIYLSVQEFLPIL